MVILLYHGTIIAEITCKKSAYLWSRARLVINKKQHFSCYQTTSSLKIWFLFLVSTKGQKKDKSEFITKFVRIIVTIVFIMSLKFLVKPLLHRVFFFTDHLKHKTVKKTTCRMPSANLYQLCAHYLKSFPNVTIILGALSVFIWQNWVYLGLFLITFKFS